MDEITEVSKTFPRRQFLRMGLALTGKLALKKPFGGEESEDPKLSEFLATINAREKGMETFFEDHGADPKILDMFFCKDKADLLANFRMYFPMYAAAKLKYNIDEILLMITHATETRYSIAKKPDHYAVYKGRIYTNVGAMQRTTNFYKEDYVDEAVRGYDFLEKLPQRYPKDYREIMFAAKKLRADAESRKGRPDLISDEERMLDAVYNYCGSSAGNRIHKYREFKIRIGKYYQEEKAKEEDR